MRGNPSLSFKSEPGICPDTRPAALQMVFALSTALLAPFLLSSQLFP